MKFIDLNKQYQVIKTIVDSNIQTVLDHGQFVLGSEVLKLEEKLAAYTDSQFCIGVSNGTDALLTALMVLKIGQGDEVITTPFSFFATAATIIILGAKPVFVDIDPKTYNINPKLIEAAITKKTKAIIPVDLYGQCADYDAINKIADKYNISVIADAAQSIGATYKNKKSGSLATITCTSFFPSKPLACYGDGGACFTNHRSLAESMRYIRDHGQNQRYNHVSIGMNRRLDTLQAAVLLAKLTIFEKELLKRQYVAKYYDHYLDKRVTKPYIQDYNISAYAQYTIQVDRREELVNMLKSQGIPTAVHYPKTLLQQPAIKTYISEKIHYPIAESVSSRVLSLPFHPYLEETEVQVVAESVNECCA